MVAAPPLPVAAPISVFDPARDRAGVDGSIVVTVQAGLLKFVDGDAGVMAAVPVDGAAELKAVSADGTRAALLHRPDSGSSLITVVERQGDEATLRTFGLAGLIEPEAFSTDGGLLFVIDHQVSDQPGAYRVRPLNLATGELETILGPTKIPLDQDMSGLGRRQIWSPDGSRLYTLYVRQTHHQHDSGATHDHGEPGTDGFVHVLDLNEEWAYCLDLPTAFGDGELATTALAVAPDGTAVAVADLSAEQIAFASTDELRVTHTTVLPNLRGMSSDEELHIGLTTSDLAIGWASEVHWFDRFSLQPLSTKPNHLDNPLTGFTTFGDGLLAWSSNLSNGPAELRPPSS